MPTASVSSKSVREKEPSSAKQSPDAFARDGALKQGYCSSEQLVQSGALLRGQATDVLVVQVSVALGAASFPATKGTWKETAPSS